MVEPERYAIVEAGLVINVVLWDGDIEAWSPPEGTEAIQCPDEVGISWTYADGEWVAPEA
jgi:hypothetical protein